MTDLLLALSGYAWGVLHDIAALRRVPYAKPFLLALSAAGHIAGWYRLLRYGPKFNPPPALRALCMLLAPAAIGAMMYSVLYEVNFRKAWVAEGHTDTLITDGTYALTRHPGVMWYTIAVLASAVAARSKRMLWAAPVMIVGDVAHVAFQERVVLTEVFGDAYRAYQQHTPFLVPTPASVQHFVQTIRPPDPPEM